MHMNNIEGISHSLSAVVSPSSHERQGSTTHSSCIPATQSMTRNIENLAPQVLTTGQHCLIGAILQATLHSSLTRVKQKTYLHHRVIRINKILKADTKDDTQLPILTLKHSNFSTL